MERSTGASREHRGRFAARLAAVVAAGTVLAVASGCAGSAAVSAPAPAVPQPAAPAALTTADVDAWLDGVVPAGIQRAGIAGAAVTVVHDGQVLTTRGYGYSDTGTDGSAPRPVDPDRTLFRVGSVSKVFTATAVMQLVEQRRIDLDADVSRYLDFPVPRRFDAPITMRNLLTHTAGFEERVGGLIHLGEIPTDLRATLADDPPEQVFAPGTTPAYSNYGYALAGYVVQRVSGMPFDTYVQREVLDRAGMTSSSFAQPLPGPLRDRLSRAYATTDPPAASVPFETVPPAPAGSLTTSATDMGRFMVAALGSGRPLLTPPTRELMERPALGPEALGTLAGAPRMALGLFDDEQGGHRTVGHGGDTQFFHAQLTMLPDDRAAVFVVLNGNGRAATDTLDLRDAVTKGFTDRYFPAAARPVVAPVAAVSTDPGHATMAAGRYVNARASFSSFLGPLELASTTTVAARPDGTVQITPGLLSPSPAVFREVRPWVWQEVGGQRTIAMRPSPDGSRVDAIGFESAFTLLRAAPLRDSALVLPVLVGSLVVLLAAFLAWPAGAAARRHHGAAALDVRDRPVRIATRTGVVCALLAVLGWAAAITAVMGLAAVPSPVLVTVVVLQWLALAGTVPALAGVVSAVRRRAGLSRVLGRVLVLLALLGVGGVAVVFGLLAPSLSY